MKLNYPVFIFGFSLVLLSCGNKADSTLSSRGEERVFSAPKMAKMESASNKSVNGFMMADAAVFSETTEFEQEISSGTETGYERKIIRNGSIVLEVENLEKSEKKLGEWASRFGGYITNSWASETSSGFTVKIPSEKFEEAFNESKNYGRFLSGNVYSDDITEQFYDLKTRLETKKVLQERLSGYLKNAKNTEDLVRIERELNSCISEIETMEGRMRRMQNQIDFSTINIELQLPYRTTTKGFEFPSLSNGLRKFGGNLLDFFILLLQAVCYITICGIPLVALVAFLFWLLFGKIGLLKKLFKKLK